jgi:hypothetical protein
VRSAAAVLLPATLLGCSQPEALVLSQASKAVGLGRQRVLLCGDEQRVSIPGLGERTFYGDASAALMLVTPYRRADGVRVAADARAAGLQVEIDTAWRAIPPGRELLYLDFPVASQWPTVCRLAVRRGVDWLVRLRLIEYRERKLEVRGCPKGGTELWFEARVRSSFAVWDTPGCRELARFDEEGRGIALVAPNDPEATNGGVDGATDYFLLTLLKEEPLPVVPIVGGVLRLRSREALMNAIDDLFVRASKRMGAVAAASPSGGTLLPSP